MLHHNTIKLLTEFVISFIIVFFNVPPSLAQSTQTKLNAYPIGQLSLNTPSTWLSNYFQDKLSGHVDLIGIGEVSHGAIEPMEFQTKMIQYLVEEKGFRNVSFERSDFYSIRPIRNYLNDNSRQDETIKNWAKSSGFTVSASNNLIELMSWLKAYNLKHPNDQVQVSGFDLSTDPAFFNYFINRYVTPLNPDEAKEFAYNFNNISDTTKIHKVRNWFNSNRKLLTDNFSKTENEWLNFHLKNIESGAKAQVLKELNRERYTRFRDSAMAENVKYLANSNKTVILAHNAHLVRNEGAYMGAHLSQSYDSDYYVILTDFSNKADVEIVPRKVDTRKENIIWTYFSQPQTTAFQVNKTYGIKSGIFQYKNLINNKLPANTNIIDVFGLQTLTSTYANAFDILVVFENLTSGQISEP